jgi:hypothetical protein
MEHEPLYPFSYNEDEYSPAIELGRDAIKVATSGFSYDGEEVSLNVHLSYSFPTSLALRYRNVAEALVIVVHDVGQRGGFALRAKNDFVGIHYPPGTRMTPNLVSDPALPIPGRGDLESDSYTGGWASGGFKFASPYPALRPSVYLYVVLENYVSNVIALDLVEQRVLDLGGGGAP